MSESSNFQNNFIDFQLYHFLLYLDQVTGFRVKPGMTVGRKKGIDIILQSFYLLL